MLAPADAAGNTGNEDAPSKTPRTAFPGSFAQNRMRYRPAPFCRTVPRRSADRAHCSALPETSVRGLPDGETNTSVAVRASTMPSIVAVVVVPPFLRHRAVPRRRSALVAATIDKGGSALPIGGDCAAGEEDCGGVAEGVAGGIDRTDAIAGRDAGMAGAGLGRDGCEPVPGHAIHTSTDATMTVTSATASLLSSDRAGLGLGRPARFGVAGGATVGPADGLADGAAGRAAG